MKKLFLLLSLITLSASAQDIIVKRDGTPILTKVLEVNSDNVKYKKHGKASGPTYTIAISDILSLTYANGDKEDFGNAATAPTETQPSAGGSSNTAAAQGLVQLPAAENNAELIHRYNAIYQPTSKIGRSSSKPKSFYVFWGVKENSLMSNSELEMTIEPKDLFEPLVMEMKGTEKNSKHRTYYIKLKNKTDRTIYIDRANCFRTLSSGSVYTYYDPMKQTTITNGSSTGVGMNMGAVAGALGVGGVLGQLAGGLTVGGGKQHSVSTTYGLQRILAIPPHGFQYLTEEKYVEAPGSKWVGYKLVEDAETFSHLSPKLPDMSSCGELKVMTEQNTSDNLQFIITYSTSESFSTYCCLTCNMYIKEVIGCKVGLVERGYFLVGASKKYQESFNGLDDFGIVGVEDIKYTPKYHRYKE